MGPYQIRTAAEVSAQTERDIEDARAEFPGWDFREVFGGFEAVPAGTPVVTATYLQTLLEKLRSREPPGSPEGTAR